MIPKLNKEFICLVSRDCPALTALVSSYLNVSGQYLPVFEFGKSLCKKEEFPGGVHKYSISHGRAEEFNIRTNNASKFLNSELTVILVGLDDNQKSYLDWIDKYNVIEIEDKHDVENYLSYMVSEREALAIRSEDILLGCYMASMENKFLSIDDTALELNYDPPSNLGLILIEENDTSCDVIAVNYAVSVKAEMQIIPKPKIEQREVNKLLELWKKENDDRYYRDLGAKIYPSIEYINFEPYQYTTIFTDYSPYALFIKNEILVSYVACNLHPDFFIFNNILYESRKSMDSAIIFSPLLFGEDEETSNVIRAFEKKNYYVESLVGKDATVVNIDYLVSEFPFQVLHLCSHGGQVDGYSLKEKITDKDGKEHVVEYYEIVSFAPQKGEEKIAATSKYIFRSLNGYPWKSYELKEQGYTSDLYAFIFEEVMKSKGKSREQRKDITDSCGIVCYHFFYQAMFDTLAGNITTPFIFNNTCWSWLNISESFLALGCRSYIGTYWNVNNDNAKIAAEHFYQSVFDKTILKAYGDALKVLQETKDQNVYGFWGLHFSTIKRSDDIKQNKLKITHRLLYSLNYWKKKKGTFQDPEIEETVERKIQWIADEISDNFQWEAMSLIISSKKEK